MMRVGIAIGLLGLPIAIGASQSDQGPPRWMANIARKQHVVMYGVPAPYTTARDRTPETTSKLWRGRAMFDQHCAACHGWSGQGTGPNAFSLVPAPADLEWLAHTPKSRSEAYIYWSIAEGGESFGSEMPAFKGSLSEKDIWAISAYLRAGMPHSSP